MTSLESFVRGHFTVSRRSGPQDLMVVCPFHLNKTGKAENTGSLAISIATGMWFCHTCGEGGGVRKLLKRMNLPDTEVPEDALSAPERSPRGRFYIPNAAVDPACILPESYLGLFDTGSRMPAAVHDWGFSYRTYRSFDLGYDPRHLRVIFPLRDFRGNLVGFSGRALDDHPARYKVYAEREYASWGISHPPLKEKGKLIWNYERVYAAIQSQHRATILVTEGFKACMWLVQLGFPLTIALLGSNMSEEQHSLLERLGGTLYLFLDNDEAGDKKHAIAQRLANTGNDVRVPTYPTKQPDLLTRPQVEEAIRNSEIVPRHEQLHPVRS